MSEGATETRHAKTKIKKECAKIKQRASIKIAPQPPSISINPTPKNEEERKKETVQTCNAKIPKKKKSN